VGSSTWLAYAYVTLCQEVVTSGELVTSQGVIDLYHFCVVVPPHVVIFYDHAFWVSDRIIKRHEGRLWNWFWTINFFFIKMTMVPL
jgi:hypothetical protein